MNLGTMRSRCKNRFRDLQNIFVLDTTWNQHINSAYSEFFQAARWPFRIVSADKTLAQNAHTVALNIPEIEFLHDVYDVTQDRALLPTPDIGAKPDEIKFRERIFLEQQHSQPVFYETVGLNLFIFPAPLAAAHTIRIYYMSPDPAQLSADSDIPDIPTRYHDALVSGAVARAFLDDGNLDSAVAFRNEFIAILQQAFSELHPRGPLTLAMDERFAKLEALRGGALEQQEARKGVGLN